MLFFVSWLSGALEFGADVSEVLLSLLVSLVLGGLPLFRTIGAKSIFTSKKSDSSSSLAELLLLLITLEDSSNDNEVLWLIGTFPMIFGFTSLGFSSDLTNNFGTLLVEDDLGLANGAVAAFASVGVGSV